MDSQEQKMITKKQRAKHDKKQKQKMIKTKEQKMMKTNGQFMFFWSRSLFFIEHNFKVL